MSPSSKRELPRPPLQDQSNLSGDQLATYRRFMENADLFPIGYVPTRGDPWLEENLSRVENGGYVELEGCVPIPREVIAQALALLDGHDVQPEEIVVGATGYTVSVRALSTLDKIALGDRQTTPEIIIEFSASPELGHDPGVELALPGNAGDQICLIGGNGHTVVGLASCVGTITFPGIKSKEHYRFSYTVDER